MRCLKTKKLLADTKKSDQNPKNRDNLVLCLQNYTDFVFENECQSFSTKKYRLLELKCAFNECYWNLRKIVDIFGNDTMKIIEVTI